MTLTEVAKAHLNCESWRGVTVELAREPLQNPGFPPPTRKYY